MLLISAHAKTEERKKKLSLIYLSHSGAGAQTTWSHTLRDGRWARRDVGAHFHAANHNLDAERRSRLAEMAKKSCRLADVAAEVEKPENGKTNNALADSEATSRYR